MPAQGSERNLFCNPKPLPSLFLAVWISLLSLNHCMPLALTIILHEKHETLAMACIWSTTLISNAAALMLADSEIGELRENSHALLGWAAPPSCESCVKGTPSSSINQWMASALFEQSMDTQPQICQPAQYYCMLLLAPSATREGSLDLSIRLVAFPADKTHSFLLIQG